MDKDKILVAEFIGSPKGGWTNWNPEQNANDDYLILEWVRGSKGELALSKFWRLLHSQWASYRNKSDWYQVPVSMRYQKGDYYRAALVLIKELNAETANTTKEA